MSAEPAAWLYRGRVAHARLRPVAHRFAYRIFALLIDVDRIEEAGRATPLLSIGRLNLLSFHPDDHGARGATTLRAHVEAALAGEGVSLEGGRILLLCQPRVLGVGFNPLSVYLAFGPDGRLAGIVHEVRNTFGERHAYVLPVRPGELAGSTLRQGARKGFRVSPFLPEEAAYRFRLSLPGPRLRLGIVTSDARGPLMAATFSGERRPLTTREAIAACLAAPFLSLKVILAIRVEALRLLALGLPFQRRRRTRTGPDAVGPHVR